MQAETVIGEFTRMIPPEHHSVLKEVAFLALDIASAGIAGGVAKRLEPALAVLLGSSGRPGGTIHYPNTPDNYQATGSRQVSAIAPQEATRAVVAIFADGIKAGIKAGGAAVKGAANGDSKGPSEEQKHGGVSVQAKAEFLKQQRTALAAQDEKLAGDVTISAFNTLLLGLDAAPEAMIGTMKAVASALDATVETAGDLQVRETVTQWVRLVAQTSLGTVPAPDGKALTAIGAANRAPTLDQPVPPRDGLIDISFTGDDRDSMAFQLGKVRVHGITQDALDALSGKDGKLPARSIRQLGLAIRVSGMMGANDSSVAVVRDEGGNIEYTDRTSRSWFARRIGVMTHATDADQRRGARQLLDQEILDRTLLSINPQTDAEPASK